MSSPDPLYYFQIPCGLFPSPLRRASTLSVQMNFGLSPLLRVLNFLCLPQLPFISALAGFESLLLSRISVGFHLLRSFRFRLFLQASVHFHPCGFPLPSVPSSFRPPPLLAKLRLSSVPLDFSFRTEVSHSILHLLRSFGFSASLEISISTSRD